MAGNDPDGSKRRSLPTERRALNVTDSSTLSRSFSLEVALRDSLALEDKLKTEASNETPDQCLKRFLSIRTVVSTTSSFAQRQQEAVDTITEFREIGTGSIGKVFEHPGTTFVYKLPLSDDPRKLWNNYIMHHRVMESFGSLPYVDGQIEVPKCFWYATPETSSFWDEYLERFPFNDHFTKRPRHVLCMERIFPLPRPVRHALVDVYCPAKGREKAKSNQADKDCLVRPYLGRVKFGSGMMFFSLRNFKLHANQMKDLGLPFSEFITGMAHALAVLHWHTRIDANDVEFVLGSSPAETQAVRGQAEVKGLQQSDAPTSTYEQVTHSRRDFTKRSICLWILDFDDCHDITMDDAGLDMAVKAFLETNHYCPRPNTGSRDISEAWDEFGKEYIFWSKNILDFTNSSHLKHLPEMFLTKVFKQTKSRRQQPAKK